MTQIVQEDPPSVKSSLYPEQVIRVVIPESPGAIHTERLYMRKLHEHDAADIFEFRSRQEVADWLWPKVPHKDIAESERTITEKVFKTPDATGKIGRQFYFAIIRKDDPHQKVIGAVGINSLDPAPSLGYGIHPDCWGKGFASEAVRAVVNAWWQLDL
ncbi:Uncharacterized protein PECH_000629 [Penicillium ucsense]|uniref:N-acetyltransferase domain-containing protein n=1 Tax=Penicillium ucsense TaxID=2839758 RepID=A0A8J8VXR2_9EURO|nr:Uncharacterized protein PECM_000685 [Penicillium ucsense]KAF7738362.1 Uncharacterized protein PECH_000629 [Penicillium ucsense]